MHMRLCTFSVFTLVVLLGFILLTTTYGIDTDLRQVLETYEQSYNAACLSIAQDRFPEAIDLLDKATGASQRWWERVGHKKYHLFRISGCGNEMRTVFQAKTSARNCLPPVEHSRMLSDSSAFE